MIENTFAVEKQAMATIRASRFLLCLCAAIWVPFAAWAETPGNESDVGSAVADELRRFCADSEVPCREHMRIVLRREDGETYDETFALLPPAVQEGMVTIHPGETVRVVPVFEQDAFVRWRAPAADEPADTQVLTIALRQMEDDAGMMASVSTNTGPALKLRMGMIALDGGDEPRPTSSCPLAAGGGRSFEMWPEPIFLLLVADATRPAEDDRVCR